MYTLDQQEHQGITLKFNEGNLNKKDKNVLSLRKYTGKQLVSYLRQGDFAHAGEEKAIELVMSKYRKDNNQQILDVGCGLGGTANYIHEQSWGNVTGFDVENESIQYAVEHYPAVTFHTADVCHINELFIHKAFDIICLFNSFYAFNNQTAALKALNAIAKTTTQLVIFDYSVASLNGSNVFFREGSENQTPFKPVVINNIKATLKATQWQLNELINITDKYIHWYEELINKLENNKDYIMTEFGKDAYTKALATYSDIYNALTKAELGGVIVYVEKLS